MAPEKEEALLSFMCATPQHVPLAEGVRSDPSGGAIFCPETVLL